MKKDSLTKGQLERYLQIYRMKRKEEKESKITSSSYDIGLEYDALLNEEAEIHLLSTK